MIKKIISLFFIIVFSNCSKDYNINHINSASNFNKDFTTDSGQYLAANFLLSKGDALTASKVLNFKNLNHNNNEIIELAFLSNLINGDFQKANKASDILIVKKNKNLFLNIPEFTHHIRKNNYKKSVVLLKKNIHLPGFKGINLILQEWLKYTPNKNLIIYNSSLKTSVHQLLILENFYDPESLKEIAIYNTELTSISNIDLLLLAGFFYRINDMKNFKNIIIKKLPDTFDKNHILNNFNSNNNFFKNKQSLQNIISGYLYNVAFNLQKHNEINISYIKILLEMAIYFSPNMDISKYALSEIYSDQNLIDIAMLKLNAIEQKSFFYLPANIKKLSIFKEKINNNSYIKLLNKIKKIWPHHKNIKYELADLYKKNKEYNKAYALYDTLLKIDPTNSYLLFQKAICLERLSKWKEAKEIFIKIIANNEQDTYSLNYLDYSMAEKKENLVYAENLIHKALKLKPNNPYFLDTLGWIYFQQEQYLSALFFLERAVIIDPTSSEIIDHLADCYLALGRTKEALYEWKKALLFDKNNNLKSALFKKIKTHE